MAAQDAASHGPLTEEEFFDTIKRWLKADEERRKLPRGPCGCTACIVSKPTRDRLERRGGTARCGNCGRAFYVSPPDAR